jgi:cytochrome oxidase Cu insertion factor (SCO1/SenC/PrrC family)
VDSLYRFRWALWVAVLLIGAGIGTLLAFSRSSSKPVAKAPPADKGFTWAAGAKRAPDFKLADQNGSPVSMSGFRGHPVLITFMDPACKTLCPREAKTLGAVVRSLPSAQRPVVIAVNVNRRVDGKHILLRDMSKWNVPATWHWAVGKQAALSGVWSAYGIGVQYDKRTQDVTHTEATYVVDRRGFERALFMYPFLPGDLVRAVGRL